MTVYPSPTLQLINLSPTLRIETINSVTTTTRIRNREIFANLNHECLIINFSNLSTGRSHLSPGFLSSTAPGSDPYRFDPNYSNNYDCWLERTTINSIFPDNALYAMSDPLPLESRLEFEIIDRVIKTPQNAYSPNPFWRITGTTISEASGIGGEITLITFTQPVSGASTGGGWWSNFGVSGISIHTIDGETYIFVFDSDTTEYFPNGGYYQTFVSERELFIELYFALLEQEEASMIGRVKRNGTYDLLFVTSPKIQVGEWGDCGWDLKYIGATGNPHPGFNPWQEAETGGFGIDPQKYNPNWGFGDYFHQYLQDESASYIPEEKYCCCDDIFNNRYADLITDAGNIVRPSPGSLI